MDQRPVLPIGEPVDAGPLAAVPLVVRVDGACGDLIHEDLLRAESRRRGWEQFPLLNAPD